MSDIDHRLERYSTRAIESAATKLGVRPIDLARRLAHGEITRLLELLNAAFRHVDNEPLRHRIEDTLLAISDGRMPNQSPESELDWALRVVKDRRDSQADPTEPEAV